jgi:hypothetical protein
MMGIARLLRADVRALVAQDTDALEDAEGAVQDANYAKELLRNNPAALWVSVNAHLAKAGVHEHSGERDQRHVELELAGQDADDLKPFSALPEAVVYRWLYFRESKELLERPERFDTLRREALLACLRYNAGDLPANQFIDGAKGSRWNQCLVHYYVAMTKLAEGDRIAAQEHFDKAIKTRALQWGPYDMSWVFQARLAKDRAWPRWISKSG